MHNPIYTERISEELGKVREELVSDDYSWERLEANVESVIPNTIVVVFGILNAVILWDPDTYDYVVSFHDSFSGPYKQMRFRNDRTLALRDYLVASIIHEFYEKIDKERELPEPDIYYVAF